MEEFQRKYEGMAGKIISTLSILMMVWAVMAVVEAFGFISTITPLRLFVFPGQFLALFLGFALVLTFLLCPARKSHVRPQWYDWALLAISAVSTLYLFLNWDRVEYEVYKEATLHEIILATGAVIAILEAARRTVGLTVTLLVIAFIVYPLICNKLPGVLMGKGYSPARLAQEFYLGIGGIFGVPLQMIARIAAMFVLFGEFFNITGAGKLFIDGAFALFGHVRGGPAKVAVVSSGLFGSISGSPVANVVATGTFTIPMMKKVGYPPHFAGAVEAAASTGGSLMPPVMGVVAFIMAGVMGVPYLEVCIAAALPAVLYYFAIFLQVDMRAATVGLKGLPRESLPSLRETAKGGWFLLFALVLLVILLAVWKISAERAAVYSIAFLVLLSFFSKETRLNIKKVGICLDRGGKGMLMLAAVTAAVGMITGSVYLTGVAGNLSPILIAASGGNIFILLLCTTVLAFIMGMGTGAVTIYIILATLIAPVLIKAGINPMSAHLFIFYYGMLSFLTPPVCVAAYVGAAIAGADPMKTGWQATRLAGVAYIVPFMLVYAPPLILRGTFWEVFIAVPAALVGCIGLAVGLEGYFWGQVNRVLRIMAFIGGAFLIFPGTRTDIAGIILLSIVALYQWFGKSWFKRSAPA